MTESHWEELPNEWDELIRDKRRELARVFRKREHLEAKLNALNRRIREGEDRRNRSSQN